MTIKKCLLISFMVLIFLSLACSFSGATGSGDVQSKETIEPSSVQSGNKSSPSWFEIDPKCRMDESMASSKGSPYAYDPEGNLKELLPDGKTTCVLEIRVCGDTIFKQQVIDDASQDCPDSLHYLSVPSVSICCDEWEAAKQSASPCNPMIDADCDGVQNNDDAHPLDYSIQ